MFGETTQTEHLLCETLSHRESQSEPDAFSTNVSATQEIKSSLKRSASSDNDKSKYVNRQTEIWAREAQC